MKNRNDIAPVDPDSLQKVEAKIQAKIDSGYTAPCGWLFRGLTFFFHQTTKYSICDVTRNLSQFAGAAISESIESPDVTHIIVSKDSLSPMDLSSLRGSLSTRPGRMPHLVDSKWVEDSWSNKTLLDEESKLPALGSLELNLASAFLLGA